ncbi:unnamed protein product [Adineta steineri]|uniref:Mothers against decapentaplegic homolog n=1 Tax=Adineta steineri TaxID=433720 RepID=A0A814MI97_9BILA|nr:unnamed protein product [Adineta steineri]
MADIPFDYNIDKQVRIPEDATIFVQQRRITDQTISEDTQRPIRTSTNNDWNPIMSNLFNLPFAFSINPETLKNLLQHRKNIQPNSGDDKWSEKAIKGLIKRLTKASMIDDLQTALDTQSSQTRCVTIPRDAQKKLIEPNPSQTVRKAFHDITPVVAFCRIWRWPDLNTHLELRPNETCVNAFQHEKDQICVNPYHYERVVAPFIPPVYVPVSDRAVFDSTTSERMQIQPDSTVPMDFATSPADQQRTAVNSPASVQDNYEAMTPTQASINQQQQQQQQQVAATNFNGIQTAPIAYAETPFWCSILYYELNQRVGEIFHASLNSLVIDGFCDPNASDRFCLGSLTNVNRTTESEACRRMIGSGVRLYYIGGKPTWALPFPGSDKSVVQRTQYFNYTQLNKKPIRFQPYIQISSLFAVIQILFFGSIFSLLTKFKLGIQCLLKYPGLFSGGCVTHEGPTRAECEQASFKMTFVTHTENKQKLTHEFAGPDPGYLGTSQMLIACAVMLLKENNRLPVKGGVLTPGAAFGRTILMDYLEKEGFSMTRK